MIDDLHLVKDPFLLEYGIQFLIEHAPPNLHFVMSARGLLPLSLEHLHADGEAVVGIVRLVDVVAALK